MIFEAMPLFVVALPLAMLFLILRFLRQQTDARYRTLLQLAETGVDLPLDVLAKHRRPQDDRRRGIVLVSGGLGLILCLLALPVQTEQGHNIGEIWGLGLLPAMMGLGYLLNWWLETRAGASDGP
jgi:hypothetical protein